MRGAFMIAKETLSHTLQAHVNICSAHAPYARNTHTHKRAEHICCIYINVYTGEHENTRVYSLGTKSTSFYVRATKHVYAELSEAHTSKHRANKYGTTRMRLPR